MTEPGSSRKRPGPQGASRWRGDRPAGSSAPFIGRARELEAIDDLFARGERLVTILGPGGVGKTRIAVELASRYGGGFEGELDEGVYIFDLSEVDDVTSLCDAVADGLGLPPLLDGGDSVERIGEALAARGACLSVLDNFDRIVPFADESLSRWLALAPELRLLITSRERLHLHHEALIELGPMPLPSTESAETSSDAMELFLRAAQRARRGWSLKPGESQYVVELLRELDGLPLAIELAAARMAVMGPRALLHRLRSGLTVLRRTQRGGASRHETLEHAVDWSWQMLAPWEQAVLAQCAVFRGGFSLEAAEAVIELPAQQGAVEIVDVIQSLRDKSLLSASEPPELEGELRLGQYESVRVFAERRLDERGERDALEMRHAAYYVQAGARWCARAERPDGTFERALLLIERENLLALAERVTRRSPVTVASAQPALEALLILEPVLRVHGPIEGFARLINPVLDVTLGSGADPKLLCRALAAQGRLETARGNQRAGLDALMQALTLATKIDDEPLKGKIELDLAQALMQAGQLEGARERAERALAICDATVLRTEGVGVCSLLGQIAAKEGKLDDAQSYYRDALSRLSMGAASSDEAHLRALIGELHHGNGQLDAARASLTSAQLLYTELGDKRGALSAAAALALLDHDSGELDRAWSGLISVKERFEELGFHRIAARLSLSLGVLLHELGRLEEGEKFFAIAAEEGRRFGDGELLPLALAHRAALQAEAGRQEEAVAALSMANAEVASQGESGAVMAILGLLSKHVERSLTSQDLLRAGKTSHSTVTLRLAVRCLDAVQRRRVQPQPQSQPEREALLVGERGLWFQPPRGEKVTLEKRKPLRLIVERLLWLRLESAGTALAWDGLLQAGWPDEKVIASAGAHRVRVAVSTLRKLGLRGVLITNDDGYLFDPEVPTYLAE